MIKKREMCQSNLSKHLNTCKSFKSLQRNINVISLDLSWNGLGYEGSIGIGEMLRGNDCLRKLDITSNRINWQGAILVARGLAFNSTLEVLKVLTE